MKKLIFFALVSLLWACSQSKPTASEEVEQTIPPAVTTDTIAADPAPSTNSYANATIEVKTFAAEGGGFGYDIYINGVKTIHQPHRPGLPGNQGFDTEAKASKAGEFVAAKIRNNLMPPSISQKELDSLGVL
jgi:hypothetical protein